MTDAEKALRAQVKCEMLRLAIGYAEGEDLKQIFALAETYTMFVMDELKPASTHRAGPKINVSKSN